MSPPGGTGPRFVGSAISRGWRIHGVLCHVCGALGYNADMPRQRHYYGSNPLHSITASTYRRGRTHRRERDLCATRGWRIRGVL